MDSTGTDLLRLGALELAALIRARQVSPVEVVRRHIARIEQTAPTINALAVPRFEAALEEAARAEQAVLRGDELGLLHGVPCTVKEGLGVRGMPKTTGSPLRRSWRAAADATVVARVRAAGAIVVGLTNLSEMALWAESDNPVYGRTGNPYDPRRTAGGSSGGEAAIVAAGGSPFGIGTDGGGSIRLPAAYCGVFGHKPSSGTAPLTGHMPLDERFGSLPWAQAMARYFAPGPLARSARDLMPLLRIMAGPDGCDGNVTARPLGDAAAFEFAGRRVLVCAEPDLGRAGRPSGDMAAAVRRAARALETDGAVVEAWDDPLLRGAFDIWLGTVAGAGGPPMAVLLGDGQPLRPLAAMIGGWFGGPRHSTAALATAAAERILAPSPARLHRFRQAGETLLRRLETALGTDGVLLMPVAVRPAPRHGCTLLRPFGCAAAALFNALECPATVAPVGLMPGGLPGAVQIVAARGADHATIAGALALERSLGGWTPPPASS